MMRYICIVPRMEAHAGKRTEGLVNATTRVENKGGTSVPPFVVLVNG